MTKRVLAILMAAMMICMLAACGGDTQDAASDPAPASSPVVSEPAASEPTQSEPEASESEYYFADNVLLTEDFKIEITDYKVIQPGEVGNEYGEKPIIAFWYNTTNISGEETDPMTAWIFSFTAVQDNDPNMINELEVGMHPDDTLLDNQMATIKQGGTIANAMAYELDDLTTPITLTASVDFGFSELGTQTFEIA